MRFLGGSAALRAGFRLLASPGRLGGTEDGAGSTEAAEDSYYFPPGRSMARRVHGDRAVGLLYGQRALLIGALEPLAFTGTVLASKAGDHPFARLAHTAKVQETVFLGTRAEADAALDAVHRLHQRVEGTLPHAAGRYPAGTPYSACDPNLMLWTLAVIADSGRAVYEAMVRRLSEAEREALWQDYVRFGQLFGMPREAAPATYCEFRAWWDERLASPDLQPTPHALEVAPLVAFEQPVPAVARANLALQNLVIKGTLPRRVRDAFGITWTALHETSFRAFTANHRLARHLFPRSLRRGRNDLFFDAVTRSERLRGGTRTSAPPTAVR
ncbi:MAG TPA: oxygenase MpaB family protein [Solirubrobacterales bacterium]|nr:oxygenase MpaB family protein [Solirubrobacterales bacterium]